jgi:hypothetical protein
MEPWPHRPLIYEINTWTWLAELSRKYKQAITLENIPEEEWNALAGWHFDAVWLMGVWERSPKGRSIAQTLPGLQAEYARALPDYTSEDVVGSPYCVRRYQVETRLGGPQGLAQARAALAKRGLRLVLDFVPNHTARDHPWVEEHPEFYIRGTKEDLKKTPEDFFRNQDGEIIACGRDPYFPPWTDTAQINAFRPELRQAVIATLMEIADQCDGVRCDMAMLLSQKVFSRTWGARAGKTPTVEYWRAIIPVVRVWHPDFLFMAEAYWDMEWELHQQGFDYCYDKRLYDRLVNEDAESVRLHLTAELAFQEKLLRFIENHDEPRCAAVFSPQKRRAAAVTVLTQVGAKLIHEGQPEGRQVKLPVQLGRRPDESVDQDLLHFYRRLLETLGESGLQEGDWRLVERSGWIDNPSFMNLGAWGWMKGNRHNLVVVNLSDYPSQARLHLPWDDLRGKSWEIVDALNGDAFTRAGDEISEHGLYVGLEPWGFHFLIF